MSSYVSWLVTVLDGTTLAKYALKVHRDLLPDDCYTCYMEPEHRAFIHTLLPLHVRDCGPIVAIDEIFEVEVILAERPPAGIPDA